MNIRTTLKTTPRSLVLLSFALLPKDANAQYPYPSLFQDDDGCDLHQVLVAPQVLAPFPIRLDDTNTAGFRTGYSIVTSAYERPNPLGHALGGSETVYESTSRIVPNTILGQPMDGIQPFARPNSAGWSTGYSAVISKHQRPNPLGAALGGRETITETTTRIVPNDALGMPMRGVGVWP